ncbi:DUF3592 domain-containing protein [Hymenobacter volaticus]|uniref:DUF3592 domain-containing protein n=1 Tax=Hymenobacter volaticus TaxID=2932254 RepID=A0ABY4GE63_9BACT|nr:DUF3592 domain-containing protein [Hymenobacter volaticus]UOQ69143.1 DUF3592 domain-containing protein [Hymenobacter volaticus]
MDYILYLAVGASVALFGWTASRALYLRWHGIATTGTITALVRTADGDGVSYAPRVAFFTQEGIRIEVTSSVSTQEAGDYFRVGQQVRIRYSPTNPSYFAIGGYEVTSVLFLLLFAGMAVGILWLLTRS